jgi:hypothetical protein
MGVTFSGGSSSLRAERPSRQRELLGSSAGGRSGAAFRPPAALSIYPSRP